MAKIQQDAHGYSVTLAAYLLAAMALAPARAQTPVETVLYNFKNPPKGAGPVGGLIRDSSGNFYGTTLDGGPAGAGVVYKLDAAGHETVLYSFTGGADGSAPQATLIRDAAGNLYGTAFGGGITTGVCAIQEPVGCGVVYKLDPSGHQTVLYSFTGGADGGIPYAGVVRDPEGNLYGTTFYYGALNGGMVYKVDPSGQQTVLHTFTGGADGSFPGSVILDSAGNLYGTTFEGGTRNVGVIDKVDPAGHLTTLFNFTNAADGYSPFLQTLVRDSAGNFYGTTYIGGAANQGVVFKVDTAGHETVLHSFTGGADGGAPYAGVILDSAGNLYGATASGGSTAGACGSLFPGGCGVVFKLDPGGNETVLHSFTGTDGNVPDSVLLDLAGNIYGTANQGGTTNLGTIYKLDAAGQFTVLYNFPGSASGNLPFAPVIRDEAGSLYGTTYDGGPANAGVVYRLDPAGRETVLYSFTGGADGGHPEAGVVRDAHGTFYGTTYYGGISAGACGDHFPAGCGVVFKLDSGGRETVLYSFTGGADGRFPIAGVVRDSAGNLYGTTEFGGASDAGVVYKVDPAGTQTVLHTFTGGADGGTPFAGVILDSAGNLYGTTVGGGTAGDGVVYKLDPAGQETVLHNFTGGDDGNTPWGGVVLDSSGNLYGATNMGGTANRGVVFKVDPAGQETVLYTFSGGDDGGSPQSGLILDACGNLYGTTYNGGNKDVGVVYELSAAGRETVLYSFTDGADGGYPEAGVILDDSGNLYGTAPHGGERSSGAVFRVSLFGVCAP